MGPPHPVLESSFDAIFEQNQKAVLAYFIGHGLVREDAKDLLQEVFAKLWMNLADLHPLTRDQQRFWLFGVARNLLCDHKRRSTVRSNSQSRIIQESENLQPNDQHRQLELGMQVEALDRAIAALPEGRRLILSLSVLGEMTSEEIGAQLGKPAGTIRYELNQARTALTRKMEQWMQEK